MFKAVFFVYLMLFSVAGNAQNTLQVCDVAKAYGDYAHHSEGGLRTSDPRAIDMTRAVAITQLNHDVYEIERPKLLTQKIPENILAVIDYYYRDYVEIIKSSYVLVNFDYPTFIKEFRRFVPDAYADLSDEKLTQLLNGGIIFSAKGRLQSAIAKYEATLKEGLTPADTPLYNQVDEQVEQAACREMKSRLTPQ